MTIVGGMAIPPPALRCLCARGVLRRAADARAFSCRDENVFNAGQNNVRGEGYHNNNSEYEDKDRAPALVTTAVARELRRMQ
mgnify:CR=1 FL=1